MTTGTSNPVSGLALTLSGVGMTCLASFLNREGFGIDELLAFLGPFAIVVGVGAMIREFQSTFNETSLSDSLWYLAGTGAGALNLYRLGVLGAEAHARGLGSKSYFAIAIFGVCFLWTFVRSLFAKAFNSDQGDFTNTILALSVISLAASVPFLTWVAEDLQFETLSLLFWAWVSWSASVFAVLASHFIGLLVLRSGVRQGLGWPVVVLNVTGATLFLGGVVLAAVCVSKLVAAKP